MKAHWGGTKTSHHDNPFSVHYEIKYTGKVWKKHAKTRYFQSNGLWQGVIRYFSIKLSLANFMII